MQVRVEPQVLVKLPIGTHHKIALALLISHLLLKSGAQGVEGCSARGGLGIREDTNYNGGSACAQKRPPALLTYST